MKSLRTSLAAAALVFVSAASAYAQSRGAKNFEVGYSYCIAQADFKYVDKYFNENTGVLRDTNSTERITSTGGLGFVGGYYWGVAKMGEQSKLAVSLAYMYNAYLWESNSFSYSANSRTGTTSSGSGTIEMALPVGMDYKYGCDAMQDKSQKFCATFGAGVYPSLDFTSYKGDAGLGFKMRPYIKAEVGFFAGICFKIRMTYIAGKIDYISYEDSGRGYETSTKLKSAGTTALSLVLMPFSWKWGKEDWWGR